MRSTMLDEAAAAAWAEITADPRVLVPTDGLSAGPDAIEALAEAGLVSVCQWDGRACSTLTPLAASRLGLRVVRRRSGALEWTDKPPKRKRPRGEPGDVVDPAQVVDKSPRPDEAAELNERIDALSRDRARRRNWTDAEKAGRDLPRPASLLTGSAPWSRLVGVPCPACGGAPLASGTYCLRCDRWGLDWLLRRLAPDVGKPVRAKRGARFRPRGAAV